MSNYSVFSVPGTFAGVTSGSDDTLVTFPIPAGATITGANWKVTGSFNDGATGNQFKSIAQTGSPTYVNTVSVGTTNSTGLLTIINVGYTAVGPNQLLNIIAAIGSNLLARFRASLRDVGSASYTINTFELQLVGSGFPVILSSPPKRNPFHVRILRHKMNECKIAYQPIWDRITGITALPLGFQVFDETEPDYLIFQPGRIFDGLNSINSNIGVRAYAGKYSTPGWHTSGVSPIQGIPIFTHQGDVDGFIPWNGNSRSTRRKLNLYLEFYGNTTALAAAVFEFSLQGFTGA